jgi:CDP-diacylglycerol--glycerol-3-phosphate 3-phosphatidyltransferase
MAKIFGSFKSGARAAFDPLGRALVRAGISPDAVTIAGTAGVVAVSIALVPSGHLFAATIAITVLALFDVLDGSMARTLGRTTRFGALLDSSMDRIADAALFGTLMWWLFANDRRLLAGVTLVCLIGGQLVSYVKARAEGLGFSCNVGLAERMERLIIIGVGGLSTPFISWGLPLVLWVLAVLTVITVVQRLVHVRRQEQRAAKEAVR